jgi:hypothetical protein
MSDPDKTRDDHVIQPDDLTVGATSNGPDDDPQPEPEPEDEER